MAENKERLPEKQEVPKDEPTFTQRRVFLSREQVDDFYYGFANQALWPLCHYFIGRCHFAPKQWKAYLQVNELYVRAIAEEARAESDIVWIQDHHMALVGKPLPELRKVRGGVSGRRMERGGGYHLPRGSRGDAAWDRGELRVLQRRFGRLLGVEKLRLAVDRLDYSKGIKERDARAERASRDRRGLSRRRLGQSVRYWRDSFGDRVGARYGLCHGQCNHEADARTGEDKRSRVVDR